MSTIDPIDAAATALDEAFGEVAALAAEERRVHPDHNHHRDVDGALDALRVQVRACRDSARTDRSMGNASTALATLARARAMVAEAKRQWTGRRDAALAAAGREADKRNAAVAGNFAVLAAGGSGWTRDPVLAAACDAHVSRVGAIACRLSSGTDGDFGACLADLEMAGKSLANAVGIARRELRMREAAARADAAVAARFAA
jgi:hypothetical protein